MHLAIALLWGAFTSIACTNGLGSEPQCLSKFDYDFKLAQKLAEMEREQKELRKMITDMKTMKDEENNYLVAFSAQLSSDTADLTAGTTVIFDNVTLNMGSGYDRYHGVFTAQHSGLYFFNAIISARSSSQIWIVKNGDGYEYSFVGEPKWDTGTASVTMELSKGDRVWVEGRGIISGFKLYSCKPHHCFHTSFTGFLVTTI